MLGCIYTQKIKCLLFAVKLSDFSKLVTFDRGFIQFILCNGLVSNLFSQKSYLFKEFLYWAILNPLFNLFLWWSRGTKRLKSSTLCSSLSHSHSRPYQSEEQISCSVHNLCCSLLFPEAVSSNIKVRSKSAVPSILCVAPCCPRGSLIPYKSEEHHFCADMQN